MQSVYLHRLVLCLGAPACGRHTLASSLTECYDQPYQLVFQDPRCQSPVQLDFCLDPEYIGQAAVILLIYDITSRDSYEQLKQEHFPIATQFAMSTAQKNPNYRVPHFILVGNKLDLYTRREVPFQEVKLFAQSQGVEMAEVSALRSSLQNINVLFEIIRDKLFETSMPSHYKTESSPPALPPRDMHSFSERDQMGEGGATFISDLQKGQSSAEKTDQDQNEGNVPLSTLSNFQTNQLAQGSQNVITTSQLQPTHQDASPEQDLDQLDMDMYDVDPLQDQSKEERLEEIQKRLAAVQQNSRQQNALLEVQLSSGDTFSTQQLQKAAVQAGDQVYLQNSPHKQGETAAFGNLVVQEPPEAVLLESIQEQPTYVEDSTNKGAMKTETNDRESPQFSKDSSVAFEIQPLSTPNREKILEQIEQEKEGMEQDLTSPRDELMNHQQIYIAAFQDGSGVAEQRASKKPSLMPELHEMEAVEDDDFQREVQGLDQIDENDDYGKALYEQVQAELGATRNLEGEFEKASEENRFIRIEESHFPKEGRGARSRNAGNQASEEILRSLDQQIKLTESQLDSLNQISQHAGSFYMLHSDEMEGREPPSIPQEDQEAREETLSTIKPKSPKKKPRQAGYNKQAQQGSIKAYVEKRNAIIPVFQTSLVPKKEEAKEAHKKTQKLKTTSKYHPSQLPQTAMSLRKKRHSQEKQPLITLKVKLSDRCTVQVQVNDPHQTGITIVDRILRNAQLLLPTHVKRKLAAHIEEEINKKAESLVKVVKRQNAKLLKEKREKEHQQREEAIQNVKAPVLEVDKRSQKKRMPIIGKLSVIIGNRQKGEITIRENDNPASLVRNFMHSYNLKRDQMPRILQSVKDLIDKSRKMTRSQSREDKELQRLETSMRYEPSNERQVLFRLNFELGNGKTAKITVKEGDNLVNLAHNFCITHKLMNEETHKKVQLLLQQTLMIHYQRELENSAVAAAGQ